MPRLLDLFCKAGGASDGYSRAGFEVAGIDIDPQPRYPYPFARGDVQTLDPAWVARNFDAIAASPPCPRYSSATKSHGQAVVDSHPDLLPWTREFCKATGLPYAIENVQGAVFTGRTVTLCGSMFGLPIQRHRTFETGGFSCWPPSSCNHGRLGPTYYITGHGGASGGGARWTVDTVGAYLGIDRRMTTAEYVNAIPPAYTEYVGRYMMAACEPHNV